MTSRAPTSTEVRPEDLARPTEQDQLALFAPADAPRDWEKEWVGMPEFQMGNTEPVGRITVNFASWEDMKRFGELIGQTVTRRTDSVWFPKPTNYVAPRKFRYVDES